LVLNKFAYQNLFEWTKTKTGIIFKRSSTLDTMATSDQLKLPVLEWRLVRESPKKQVLVSAIIRSVKQVLVKLFNIGISGVKIVIDLLINVHVY
jgi:hypothetical protein